MIEVTDEDVGRDVVYSPSFGEKERGTISSFNSSYVFVTFWGDDYAGFHPTRACSRCNLYWGHGEEKSVPLNSGQKNLIKITKEGMDRCGGDWALVSPHLCMVIAKTAKALPHLMEFEPDDESAWGWVRLTERGMMIYENLFGEKA